MRLRHLHLPCRGPFLYPPYALASRVQEHLRRQLLDFKDAARISSSPQSPPPTLLSFTPLPTFTLGRRQTAPLTEGEVARLQAPLHMLSNPPRQISPRPPPPSQPAIAPDADAQSDVSAQAAVLPASVVPSPRGGLTTYHGPGQTVLWPVLDLKSASHKNFTVRCYSRLLEDTTIATLRSLFGLTAFTTEDPGVWVSSRIATGDGEQPAKIAALGVHLRRHVSALGTAINLAFPGPEVTSECVNPWARIVACGLEGKTVTNVMREVATVTAADMSGAIRNDSGGRLEEAVSEAWVEELARRLGVEGVERVNRDEVISLVASLVDADNDAGPQERQYVAEIQACG
ncbi:hypothetical protein QBC46DRAFT_376141 [Diplogelasinospora grovesii]|uniref:lipoyl(octanoyl) transferase n=1 Tax=Diplogelasinospora grovesii TaxID=303347 RepID=A0AAN6NF86_9PEZI|nr:hypothetical protein QBC46DRAFT_376141 [Diplogelasinospora grovesii]